MFGDRDVRSTFAAHCREQLKDVRQRQLYIDTVQILMQRPISAAEYAAVRQHNGPGKIIAKASRAPGWPFRCLVHQPRPAALAVLAEMVAEHRVSRLDVALDLIMQTQQEAQALQEFLRRHLTQGRSYPGDWPVRATGRPSPPRPPFSPRYANVAGAVWPGRRGALAAPTVADARDVMVEGESGILACAPAWNKPVYQPALRRLTWPNGAICTTYSADEPKQLRGPQHDFGWADELASWRFSDSWDRR